jgi:hypothetical protein
LKCIVVVERSKTYQFFYFYKNLLSSFDKQGDPFFSKKKGKKNGQKSKIKTLFLFFTTSPLKGEERQTGLTFFCI